MQCFKMVVLTKFMHFNLLIIEYVLCLASMLPINHFFKTYFQFTQFSHQINLCVNLKFFLILKYIFSKNYYFKHIFPQREAPIGGQLNLHFPKTQTKKIKNNKFRRHFS